ncbi:short-chain dehydrogenase/reductase [Phenylobacterium sp.]|uniref:short-chain dehydrogenase/reductase n=1 Tax=Phenylobacterium sp. TaxID=1871053 RepID=UPI002735898C|nr:short-chain dehydrogenase/reductase [Phenylobacterium sp.]MDP3658480.1 short-chain dehydrogenase/reductase [Phenylobacterium sp.]
MDLDLKGKRALVSGASKGIGRAVATLLAEEGCDVILVSRDAALLGEAADDIRGRAQVNVQVIAADLSKQSEVERVAKEAGDLDILVNNAGAIPGGDLQTVDNDTWRHAWDLKVFGYIGLSRALYPGLARRKGVVVNVIGGAGETFPAGYIAGAAGNASLMAFTKSLGKGASKDGVRVVAINPGPVATDRLVTLRKTAAREQFGDESRWQELNKGMPYGRPAEPVEIANAVAFLASPRSAYTNAAILTIDGGG